jgi:hypothetical protein
MLYFRTLSLDISAESSVYLFVRFLVQPLLFHVLPLLRDMFQSPKDHRQARMFLHVNCNTVDTLTMCYAQN